MRLRLEHDLEPGARHVMQATLVDRAYTVSSASGRQSYAHVECLGAVPTRQVDRNLGAPEPEIDLEAAAETLLAARDVDEVTSSSVAPESPFGI